MALGFTTSSAYGSLAVIPDKGMTRNAQQKTRVIKFGDGYEQRIADGINNLKQTMSVNFATRPKAEIDDIVAFFESLGGVTKFRMTIDDSNGAETIKVVCKSWQQTWAFSP